MDASQITEIAKLKFKMTQLKSGTLKGGAAILVFEQIKCALEMSLCRLSDLGVSEDDWEKLNMDFRNAVEVNSGSILNKPDALRLAEKFGRLWEESKKSDGDAKIELLKEMYGMWPQINYAIHNKLIGNSDLKFESSTEYFQVQREMHELENLMNMFGAKK